MTEKIPVSHWREDTVITEHDWAALEAAGRVELGVDARQSVLSAITQYRDSESLFRQSPRASEVASFLMEFAAKGKEFAAIGKSQSVIAEAALDRIDLIALRKWGRKEPISAALKDVARLATAAEAAAVDLPQSDFGRPGDPYSGKLLANLEAVFHSAWGGKGRYSKSALNEFLWCAATLAGAQLQSRDAMRKRLQRHRGHKSNK